MHILISPNAFKNSLDASAAAEAIQKGFVESGLPCSTTCFPVGDGGDGTARLIIDRMKGVTIGVKVLNALRKKVSASFGLIEDGKTAIIELADASGLRHLKKSEYDPLHATTFGTGQLITHALDGGVNKIIMGIGGSATVDGAAGILEALGIRFLNKKNKVLRSIPQDLIELDKIDLSKFDKRIEKTKLIVLCDVDNFLLGAAGAPAVFGPQKGATKNDVKKLEKGLTKFRDIALDKTGKDMATIKHGGAAGGVGAGLSVFLNAELVNGIEYFLDITGFNEALQKTDLVITGEGSIDDQTLQGKGPFGVAKRAKEKNIPVIGLAGKVPLKADPSLEEYFQSLICINNEIGNIKAALKETADNLSRTAKSIGKLLSAANRFDH
jgi:glycerate kinase